jgi:hypothetical protein
VSAPEPRKLFRGRPRLTPFAEDAMDAELAIALLAVRT